MASGAPRDATPFANIADAFLEHEAGIPLISDSYMRVPAPEESGREPPGACNEAMRRRMGAWFDGRGSMCGNSCGCWRG